MEHDHIEIVGSEYSPIEIAKFILVLLGITAISIWLTVAYGPNSLQGWMRWFMGVFFLVFAGFKLVGYRMFTQMFGGYDVIAKHFPAYARLYPFIELTLAALYLFNIIPGPREVITLTVMAVSSIGVAHEIQRRTGIHCACLGNIIKLPLSTVSLIEDVGMGLMAVAMLVLR